MLTRESARAHDLLRNGDGGVVQQNHVIGIPAHRARDMEQNLVQKTQGRRNLVGDTFGGMEVAGIQAEQRLARGRIGQIEIVGAGRIALRADAEELALDGNLMMRCRAARQ